MTGKKKKHENEKLEHHLHICHVIIPLLQKLLHHHYKVKEKDKDDKIKAQIDTHTHTHTGQRRN